MRRSEWTCGCEEWCMLSADTLGSWFVYRNRLLSQPNRTRPFPVQCHTANAYKRLILEPKDQSKKRSPRNMKNVFNYLANVPCSSSSSSSTAHEYKRKTCFITLFDLRDAIFKCMNTMQIRNEFYTYRDCVPQTHRHTTEKREIGTKRAPCSRFTSTQIEWNIFSVWSSRMCVCQFSCVK